ncbi:hypothetical protein [Campylobacter mucosalis]|uniref:hypothetical protein n=1 Tax=Campylobacter mucosalis TaxID=202 RepID=UPI001593FC61|nr:hypothetical protein [Campylobacter mucosalis]
MQDVAVVIGASAESVFAINRAKMRGLKVAAFDGDSKAAGLKIADFGFVCDIKDPKNIIEILKQNCLNPLFVLPVPIGRFLITTGAINEYFKIKNTDDFNTLNLCTDKLAFHNALNGGGARAFWKKNRRDEAKFARYKLRNYY